MQMDHNVNNTDVSTHGYLLGQVMSASNTRLLARYWQTRLYPLCHAAAHYVYVSETLFRQ